MRLEQTLEMYQPRVSETRQQTYFVVGDLESLSASALYSGKVRPIKYTEYTPLTEDKSIGITHHKNGLGKLKYVGEGIEYGVPVVDLNEKPLKDWRIDKK